MRYGIGVKLKAFTIILLMMAGVCLPGCGGGDSSSANPNESSSGGLQSPDTQKLFSDISAQTGIDYIQGYQDPRSLSDVQKFCGGIASGDIDNDGWVDLFIVRGDLASHVLYKNLGNFTFVEANDDFGLPEFSHQGCGPVFADIDGDADLDLFIGGIEGQRSYLLENQLQENGSRLFIDVTQQWGLDTLTSTHTVSASFGDYNNDGRPDLFLAHWGTPAHIDKQHLFRNVNGEVFVNATIEAGLAQHIIDEPLKNATHGPDHDYSFLGSFADLNNDGYQDLLMVSDFGTSKVFMNSGSGSFTYTPSSVIKDENGMGSAVADYDNDGDLDWFVSAIFTHDSPGNRLYHNETIETAAMQLFSDRTTSLNLADGGWGWAACFADFNLDGYLDIFHVNGWSAALFDLDFNNNRSRLFINSQNSNSRVFIEKAREEGITDQEQGRGVVCFDADNDGDVDIVAVNNDYDAFKVYRNNSIDSSNPKVHFLSIQLLGLAPNTEAIGTRIYVKHRTTENDNGPYLQQMREIHIGSNFISQNPTTQYFGLGDSTIVDEVKVHWFDGRITVLSTVNVNQILTIQHPSI